MNFILVLSITLIQVLFSQLATGYSPQVPVKITPAQSPTYITKEQWKSINRLLASSNINPLPPKQETQLRNKIYEYYENWATYKAYQFKRLHKHKCRAIPLEELAMYSRKALYQATRKYNGRSKFVAYAQQIIVWELYHAMTELHPISNLPKSIRMRKTIPGNQTSRHRKQLNTRFVGEEEWMFDKLSSKSSMAPTQSPDILSRYLLTEDSQDQYREIAQKVAELEPMTQKIFYLKYQPLLENKGKEKSNREIGERLGYSEEYVRKKVEILKETFHPPFSSPLLHQIVIE
jgi:RNA polymerase sigma factor (sigma-70 family)